MQAEDHNWQFQSSKKIYNASEWRLFIREYQSSPTDLIVSAINERLDQDDSGKQALIERVKHGQSDTKAL